MQKDNISIMQVGLIMLRFLLNPRLWWRRRLFQEYKKGWLDCAKSPANRLRIPMFGTYTIKSGEVLDYQAGKMKKERKGPASIQGHFSGNWLPLASTTDILNEAREAEIRSVLKMILTGIALGVVFGFGLGYIFGHLAP